jgi:ribosome-dependent ATPase
MAEHRTQPIARLAGLRHRYRGTLALDGIDLLVPAHQTIGFIGPDGVGKSTLLGLVAGVREPQEGRIETLGADLSIRRERDGVVTEVAYMPQGLGRNLYPSLSVFENVDFFGRLFGLGRRDRKRRIDELLGATGLSEFADRPAAKLSGGMKQKLALCCALVHDPGAAHPR